MMRNNKINLHARVIIAKPETFHLVQSYYLLKDVCKDII